MYCIDEGPFASIAYGELNAVAMYCSNSTRPITKKRKNKKPVRSEFFNSSESTSSFLHVSSCV